MVVARFLGVFRVCFTLLYWNSDFWLGMFYGLLWRCLGCCVVQFSDWEGVGCVGYVHILVVVALFLVPYSKMIVYWFC